MMSKMTKDIEYEYSLFSTGHGEYFTGVGREPIKQVAKFLGDELEGSLKELLEDNPSRILSFVIVTEEAKD